jgi:hypothetical protein
MEDSLKLGLYVLLLPNGIFIANETVSSFSIEFSARFDRLRDVAQFAVPIGPGGGRAPCSMTALCSQIVIA